MAQRFETVAATAPEASPERMPPVRLTAVAPMREIFGIDLRTLALFRVGLATLILIDLALRLRDFTAHYTDFGVMPRALQMAHLDPGTVSLHLANGAAWFQATLFAAAAIFAVLLFFGWRTRLAAVASWALLLSVQNRNTLILSGEDNLLLLLAFWAMFLPLGARWSVDAALDRNEERRGNSYFSIATLALLVQGASMYLFSALLKSDPQWIPDGTAVYYALQLDYFVRPVGLWLRQFPDLMQALTYYVWVLEIAAPVLLFSPFLLRPLRALLIPMLMTMHLGFFLCLEIGIFSFVSILMNATFVQGWMWDALARRLGVGRHAGLRVWYDRDCGFCLRACRLLTVFLVLPEAKIVPAQDDPVAGPLLERHNSWVVRVGADAPRLKWDAVRYLVELSPVFGPLARLLALRPLRALGDFAYLRIAANRGALGRLTGRLMPWRAVRTRLPVPAALFAAAALVLVCAQNVSAIPATGLRLPESVRTVRQALGLWQNWTMFAPHPEMTSAWPVIVGHLEDGTVVDVYNRRLEAPDWEKPARVSAVFGTHRWRKYLSRIEDFSYDRPENDFIREYGRWLCRGWNRAAAPGRRLSEFRIHFQVEWTKPPGQPKDLVRRHVWTHGCFAR